MHASATLGEIAGRLGGELTGDPATRIDAVGPLESASSSTIAFQTDPAAPSDSAARTIQMAR